MKNANDTSGVGSGVGTDDGSDEGAADGYLSERRVDDN
jgi:hypothetical protein